ncbi:UDP-2,3-diacylglucosamine diphosphatase [Acidihalobacter prosperus]
MVQEQLFISDLHLDPSRPEIIKLFLGFLEKRASKAKALYILGDLFEYWIGDDDVRSGLSPVINGLQQLHKQGIPLYFMRGNRDFLVGSGFADYTGCTLLDDIHHMQIAGENAVLMHGDTLCTDDVPYQKLRAVLRDPSWQSQFLSLPIEERRKQAEALRAESQNAMKGKQESIMDVNPETVVSCFQENNVSLLIHGHTHRPGQHELTIGKTQNKRIVLGDWYSEGSVLSVASNRLTLESLPPGSYN